MSTIDPFTLRLPPWLCRSFDLARVIANEHRAIGRSVGACQYDCFDMRSHERAFVKTLLSRRRNLWLFRTNQRKFCGDFIAVDMSPSRPAQRRAFVLELKMGDRLVIGGARLQCANHRAAVAELVARAVLAAESPVELLYGGETAVLSHLGA